MNIKSNVLGNVQVVPSHGHSSGQSTSLKLESLCGKICVTLSNCPIIHVKSKYNNHILQTNPLYREEEANDDRDMTFRTQQNKVIISLLAREMI